MKQRKLISRINLMFLSALICLTSIAFTSCGKASSPRPPEDFAPSAITTISASADNSSVKLSWIAPTTTIQNKPLLDLEEFVVTRSEFEFDKFGLVKEIAQIEVPNQQAEAIRRIEFKDENVQSGLKYRYQVFPVNTKGVLGSSAVNVVVTFNGSNSIIEVY